MKVWFHKDKKAGQALRFRDGAVYDYTEAGQYVRRGNPKLSKAERRAAKRERRMARMEAALA
jgi:hypothetical protein